MYVICCTALRVPLATFVTYMHKCWVASLHPSHTGVCWQPFTVRVHGSPAIGYT